MMIRDDIIQQTDDRLTEAHARYGCRLMCLLAIPQFVTGRALTAAQILDITERGKVTPRVIVNDKLRCGSSEHLLINWAFAALKENRRGRQVGWAEDHEYSVQWDWMIAHWNTRGPDGHFTLHDDTKKCVYDPHNPVQAGYHIEMLSLARKLFYRTWEV
jgi:hypothetical protein